MLLPFSHPTFQAMLTLANLPYKAFLSANANVQANCLSQLEEHLSRRLAHPMRIRFTKRANEIFIGEVEQDKIIPISGSLQGRLDQLVRVDPTTTTPFL